MKAPFEERRERFRVEEESAERLDTFLARRLDLSRTRVARLIDEGLVLVDGAPPKKSELVREGQWIEVTIPPPAPSWAEPQDLPLEVVYEDEDLLVVNKPAGLVVHPAPGHPEGTLVNALLFRVKDLSGIGGVLRPGIVHRLDKDTSGLLMVAKNDRAHESLSEALRRRKIRRLYRAVTWGHLAGSPLAIDAPLGRSPRDRKRMAVVEGGRRAVTRVRVRERWVAAEYLDVALETGRTHQIRVHLAHIGHPVVGDDVYGAAWERGVSGRGRVWARELARRVPRQFLHAGQLELTHPSTGEVLRFRAPLPEDLREAARWARAHSSPEP
jgi:23S rRNA pseudouridine1911/1915/1917 synthase